MVSSSPSWDTPAHLPGPIGSARTLAGPRRSAPCPSSLSEEVWRTVALIQRHSAGPFSVWARSSIARGSRVSSATARLRRGRFDRRRGTRSSVGRKFARRRTHRPRRNPPMRAWRGRGCHRGRASQSGGLDPAVGTPQAQREARPVGVGKPAGERPPPLFHPHRGDAREAGGAPRGIGAEHEADDGRGAGGDEYGLPRQHG